MVGDICWGGGACWVAGDVRARGVDVTDPDIKKKLKSLGQKKKKPSGL